MRVQTFLVLCAWLVAQTSTANAVLAEATRVQRDLQRVASEEERSGLDARLQRSMEAARKGRAYLALHELAAPWRSQHAYSFAAQLKGRVTTMDAFRAEWQRTGVPRIPPFDGGTLPTVVSALASSSESAAAATYRASLPYAEDVDVGSGLYYLGDAYAAAGFGAFCRSLGFPTPGPRLKLRSIAAAMDRFERDVFKLYDKADAAGRRPFIQINVGMKIARERDGQGDYAAALLQYMLARHQLGILVTGPGGAQADDVSKRLKLFQGAMKNADHSIGELFVQLATTQLENGDGGGMRSATAVVDFVLPEYMEIVQR